MIAPPALSAPVLMVALFLAAWLRFDAGSLLWSWSLAAICLAGVVVGSLVRARRLPPLRLPAVVEALSDKDELTPEEETQFAEALRGWHSDNQREAWREVARRGPGRLIRARAGFYFLWASFAAIVLFPPAVVPGVLDDRVPRSIIVLVPLAAAAVAIAAPLGIRDWRRARQALARGSIRSMNAAPYSE